MMGKCKSYLLACPPRGAERMSAYKVDSENRPIIFLSLVFYVGLFVRPPW